MRSSSFVWKQSWRTAAFHENTILWRETFHQITHCCGYKPCARATGSRGGCLARLDSIGGYVATKPHTVAGPDKASLPRSHSRGEYFIADFARPDGWSTPP